MFDFVSEATNVIILVIMLCAIFIVVKYYDRFLVLFTGDDRVHMSSGSLCWIVCCRCGYLCDGEWTRVATEWLCCCWPSIQGVNLKRYLGQQVGVVPIPIRMSNIIVGDLPCTGRKSFYVEVSAGEYPSQNTSVAEEQDPKLVQFEESLLLRLRFSLTEKKVRIVVKELHILGSQDICDCYICPINMLNWRRGNRGPRRVKMEPMDRREAALFPPWILMEVSTLPEWTHRTNFDARVTTWGPENSMLTEFHSAAEFKGQFPLFDPRGARALEPREEQVGELDRIKRLESTCLKACCWNLWMPLVLYITLHFFAFVCYDEYFKIEVYTAHNQTFPVARDAESAILQECAQELKGNELYRFMRYRLLTECNVASDSVAAGAAAAGATLDNVTGDNLDGLGDLANAAADAAGKANVVDALAGASVGEADGPSGDEEAIGVVDLGNGSASITDPTVVATHPAATVSNAISGGNESVDVTHVSVHVNSADGQAQAIPSAARDPDRGRAADVDKGAVHSSASTTTATHVTTSVSIATSVSSETADLANRRAGVVSTDASATGANHSARGPVGGRATDSIDVSAGAPMDEADGPSGDDQAFGTVDVVKRAADLTTPTTTATHATATVTSATSVSSGTSMSSATSASSESAVIANTRAGVTNKNASARETNNSAGRATGGRAGDGVDVSVEAPVEKVEGTRDDQAIVTVDVGSSVADFTTPTATATHVTATVSSATSSNSESADLAHGIAVVVSTDASAEEMRNSTHYPVGGRVVDVDLLGRAHGSLDDEQHSGASDLDKGTGSLSAPTSTETHETTTVRESTSAIPESTGISSTKVEFDIEDSDHSAHGPKYDRVGHQSGRAQIGSPAGVGETAPVATTKHDTAAASTTSSNAMHATEPLQSSRSSSTSGVKQPPLPASASKGYHYLPSVPADMEGTRALLDSVAEDSSCQPTMAQVMDGACSSLPPGAPPPRFFEGAFFGLLPCPSQACRVNRFMDKQAYWVRAYIAVWAVCYLLLRFAFARMIEAKDYELMSAAERGYESVPTREFSMAEPEAAGSLSRQNRARGGPPGRDFGNDEWQHQGCANACRRLALCSSNRP